MDGAALTTRRTAAASALAASYLARPDARVLTMVGAGAMASHLVRAHAAVRPITEVRLWNRSRARARRWPLSWRPMRCRWSWSKTSRLQFGQPTSSPARR